MPLYVDQQDDILGFLQPVIDAGAEVAPLPDNAADLNRPFIKSRIWFVIANSKFSEEMSTSSQIQDETISWQFLLYARGLQGDLGIYDLAVRLRKALLGKRPRFCQQLRGVELNFVDRVPETAIYNYSVTMSCKYEDVEECIEDTPPNIQQITVNMPQSGDTIVVNDIIEDGTGNSITDDTGNGLQ